ncbi:MAG: amylo-alpha-1,6-glucosidase, partial [Thermoplasmata archaeon]
RIRWSSNDHNATLPSTLDEIRVWRWGVKSRHSDETLEVGQEVSPLPSAPGIVRRLSFRNRGGVSVDLRVDTEFQPFLSPVILEGIKPYSYRAAVRGTAIEIVSGAWGLDLDSAPGPDQFCLNGEPCTKGPWEGELRTISSQHRTTVAPGATLSLTWIISGGTRRWQQAHPGSGAQELTDPASNVDRVGNEWRSWRAGTPELLFPDAPKLEHGYRLARDALRALYRSPEEGFTGLVAGYPWYSAFWGRDLAWMLPAVLWLGDHAWVASSLDAIFSLQAPADLPVLAAEAGELPMQFSPGPVFLYGTSDTTLYFPNLVRRYLDHTGDQPRTRGWDDVLHRIAGWIEARSDPSTGLVRNGGEIAALRTAVQKFGKVHYGFDAPDTTLWDSTDRRDHAIDVQTLAAVAYEALADLAEGSSSAEAAEGYRRRAALLTDAIRQRYAWPEEHYLYDTIGKNGPVARVRPNALRAICERRVERDRAREIVARAHQPDLSTSWGVRTLSALDPGFVPHAYHDGQVWTIATNWAAEAAFLTGASELGLADLLTVSDRIITEDGLANECYRGDRAEAFNSCFLLGMSVAPFLTTLFEALWGIRLHWMRRTLDVAPSFPSTWTKAELSGLRFGPGAICLQFRSGRLTARWDGAGSITLASGSHSVVLNPGETGSIEASSPA